MPSTSAEPTYARTGVRRRTMGGALCSGTKRTAKLRLAANSRPTIAWPRAASLRSIPGKLSATRDPASTRGRVDSKTPMLRTWAALPPGSSASVSPAWMLPCISVPVTTVPRPGSANARSIGK